MEDLPVFRANKKRKLVRKRDSGFNSGPGDDEQPALVNNDHDGHEDGVAVSELLKLRRNHRLRGTGVHFSQQKRFDVEQELVDGMALTKVDPDEEQMQAISNRFVGGTGQVVDVDKHMMAYIDSGMAKRQDAMTQEAIRETLQSKATRRLESNPHHPKPPAEYQPQNQLSEFDLGPDAQQKNQARTEAAIAQAQSGLPPPPPVTEARPRKPRKPRLGRDGKPMRPRPRKRRNSEDVARDALVEQMLHEHKVDMYDDEHPPESGTYEDSDADERLAEQFKQEFMDAMAERQQRNQVKAATAAKAKGIGPEQSGPKLGGSRSARAKMVLSQQQSQPKK